MTFDTEPDSGTCRVSKGGEGGGHIERTRRVSGAVASTPPRHHQDTARTHPKAWSAKRSSQVLVLDLKFQVS